MGMNFNVNVDIKTTGKEQIDTLEKQINAIKNETVKINVEVDKNSLNVKNLNIKNVSKQLQDSVNSSFKSVKTEIKEQEKQYQQLVKIRERVLSGSFEYNNARTDAFLNKYSGQDNNETLNRARNQFQEIKKLQSELTAIFNPEKSKAVKKYGVKLKALENEYRNAKTVADKVRIESEFKNLKSSISAEGLTGKSLKEDFSHGFKQIGQLAITYGTIQRVPEILKDMATEVLNVNTAMTELRKVSDANANQLSNYFEHATESAKKYGAEINDVISSAADWKRLGYSFEESGELADVTTLLQRVGDNMTQESSAGGLFSTLKGFVKDADEALSIVDKVNGVANKLFKNLDLFYKLV